MDPYLGEIRLFAGIFAPVGWAACDGQLLAITEHEALFTLLGTRYGGDGTSTFAVPDLRGRWAVGRNGANLGETGGAESVTLTAQHLPVHTHAAYASAAAATRTAPAVWASVAAPAYLPGDPATGGQTMAGDALAPVGAGLPHENLPPFLGMIHIIATAGLYPTRD